MPDSPASLTPITCPFTILIDSMEQHPFSFTGLFTDADQDNRPLIVNTQWQALGVSNGDYSIYGHHPDQARWDLGYALSVHKGQGSEWPLVVVMLDEYPGARMVCSREWLYTAISRAKRLCLMVGKMGTAVGMCRKEALGKRKTFLVEEIRKEAAIVEQIREGTANA